MNCRPDSAHISAFLGTLSGVILSHFDVIAGAACALAGLGYTLWKWRRDAKRGRPDRSKLPPRCQKCPLVVTE